MAVEKCKGTRDMSPREMKTFRTIESVFRECCLNWGYDEVRTPTIEYLYLFTAAGTLTPGKLSKVYSFLDWDGWGGERVVLRPDGTIPIARYFIETIKGKGPTRLFYVNNVFSFEETGIETREKWQCGAELIGAGSTTNDVELVVLAIEILKKLGLKNIELRLSHAGLIRAILGKFEIDPEEQHRLIDRIMDGDIRTLTESHPEFARVIAPMLEVRGKSSNFLKNIAVMLGRDFSEFHEPLQDFITLTSNLDTLGVNYEIDIASGRGFEYYTGLIFQLRSDNEMVAGGGRYDALIPLLGGSDTPASGFALYVNKLMDILETQPFPETTSTRIIIKPQPGSDSLKAAFTALDALHNAGFIAELYSPERTVEQYGTKWVLETNETGWRFSLHDLVSGSNYDAATAEEITTHLNAIK